MDDRDSSKIEYLEVAEEEYYIISNLDNDVECLGGIVCDDKIDQTFFTILSA